MTFRNDKSDIRLLGLTDTCKRVLRYKIHRPDLADQVTRVEINWGTCPVHGDFPDGLIVYRGDDDERIDATEGMMTDPDFRAAAHFVCEFVRGALGEPSLAEVTPEVLQHKHCMS